MILLSDLREGQTCSILDFLDILCSPIIRLTPRICLVLELIYLSERTFPYASNFTAEHVVIAHHDGSHPRVLPGELQGRGSLESPRDGGAWCAAVCGAAQSRTRLRRLRRGGAPSGLAPLDNVAIQGVLSHLSTGHH